MGLGQLEEVGCQPEGEQHAEFEEGFVRCGQERAQRDFVSADLGEGGGHGAVATGYADALLVRQDEAGALSDPESAWGLEHATDVVDWEDIRWSLGRGRWCVERDGDGRGPVLTGSRGLGILWVIALLILLVDVHRRLVGPRQPGGMPHGNHKTEVNQRVGVVPLPATIEDASRRGQSVLQEQVCFMLCVASRREAATESNWYVPGEIADPSQSPCEFCGLPGRCARRAVLIGDEDSRKTVNLCRRIVELFDGRDEVLSFEQQLDSGADIWSPFCISVRGNDVAEVARGALVGSNRWHQQDCVVNNMANAN